MLENFYITFYKLITVSHSIASFYKDLYGLSNAFVLPNIPASGLSSPDDSLDDLYKDFSLRSFFNIKPAQTIFIYQGLLAPSRGIKDLLHVFSKVPSAALVLMGYGPMEAEINSFIEDNHNIYFLPAVPPHQIVNVTSSADVGIFFIASNLNPSRSYKSSMPNKFFEYVFSGLPVIVSNNLYDLSRIIRENSLGYVSPPDCDSLKQLVFDLSSDFDEVKTNLMPNIRAYSSRISYLNSYKKMLTFIGFT